MNLLGRLSGYKPTSPRPPDEPKSTDVLTPVPDADLSNVLALDEVNEANKLKSKSLEQRLTELIDCPADDEAKFKEQLTIILEQMTIGLGLERKEEDGCFKGKMLEIFPWDKDEHVLNLLKEVARALEIMEKPSLAGVVHSHFNSYSPFPFLAYNDSDYDIACHAKSLGLLHADIIAGGELDLNAKKNADRPDCPIAAYSYAQLLSSRGQAAESQQYRQKFEDFLKCNDSKALVIKGVAITVGLLQAPSKPLPNPAFEPSYPQRSLLSIIDKTPVDKLSPRDKRLSPRAQVDLPVDVKEPARPTSGAPVRPLLDSTLNNPVTQAGELRRRDALAKPNNPSISIEAPSEEPSKRPPSRSKGAIQPKRDTQALIPAAPVPQRIQIGEALQELNRVDKSDYSRGWNPTKQNSDQQLAGANLVPPTPAGLSRIEQSPAPLTAVKNRFSNPFSKKEG